MNQFYIFYEKYSKLNDRIKLLANILMFSAAILVSISVVMAQHILPYTLFLASHVLWSYCALGMKDNKLFQLNAFLIIIDIWACVIRL